MNAFTTTCCALLFVALDVQTGFADPAAYQNPKMTNPDQFTPSMTGEDAFIQESQTRMKRLKEEDRKMIEEDRDMMQKGYDPNEISPQYHHSAHPDRKPPSGQ